MADQYKVKVAVPAVIRQQMELDVADYGLKSLGDLCNKVIAGAGEFIAFNPSAYAEREFLKNFAPIQFTLHISNHGFADFAKQNHVKLAALCRHYFECYVNLQRARREQFLQKLELLKLRRTMRAQENARLTYRGEIKRVSPCFIAKSPSQVRAYLVVCDEAGKFSALRLCHVKNVVQLRGERAYHARNYALSHKAELFKEHFDPFLCYGQKLKARLTEAGMEKLSRASTNRPRLLDMQGEKRATAPGDGKFETILCEFECSEALAKIYFPQFLGEAEIISPPELRDWFRKKFYDAAKVYGLPKSWERAEK